jgi:hypothetical protein
LRSARHDAAHDSGASQMSRKSPRIDALEGGHTRPLEPRKKIAVRAPVGVAARQFAHDDAGDLRLRGLGIVELTP